MTGRKMLPATELAVAGGVDDRHLIKSGQKPPRMAIQILTDARYMLMAADEAIRGIERMGPGYGGQVGCVLVGADGTVLSRSHNSVHEGTRMHAEELALANQECLYAATMYVTTEPCNGNPYHSRRHCCEQIADSGLHRVVLADLKGYYGGGAEYLLTRGVEVDWLRNDGLNTLCKLLKANAQAGGALSGKTLREIAAVRAGIYLYA
ncbi:MAG: hypothetical protein ABH879_02690 [archaeon]